MSVAVTMRTVPPSLAEAWWPLDGVAPTNSRWYAEHVEAGWWDPGDLHRSRLRHARALVDELLASLPADAVAPGAVVVELGCGPGAGLQEIARRWDCALHAWDPAPDHRIHAPLIALRATMHDVPAPPLPLADGSVDVVWAPRLFATDGAGWAGALAEAHRLLRPDGLLVAVHAGPGAWAWERSDPWDEAGTGQLLLGLDRPRERGGPTAFVSTWWLREHWGRGFDVRLMRAAGVAMLHPDQGFGLSVWQRRRGAPVSADAFAAVTPGDVREGRALRRQLELARAEQRAVAERRERALAEAGARLAALDAPDAVEDHPRVRELRAAVDALEVQP
jgi:SAM-dependent methyltransferase